MTQRIYTLDQLHSEKPKGEVIYRGASGDLWSVFCCHGCQSCLYFVDEHFEQVDQYYPHFLKPPEAVNETPYF